jgi:hypothetical protein
MAAVALTTGLITQPNFPKIMTEVTFGTYKGPGGPPDPGPVG